MCIINKNVINGHTCTQLWTIEDDYFIVLCNFGRVLRVVIVFVWTGSSYIRNVLLTPNYVTNIRNTDMHEGVSYYLNIEWFV